MTTISRPSDPKDACGPQKDWERRFRDEKEAAEYWYWRTTEDAKDYYDELYREEAE